MRFRFLDFLQIVAFVIPLCIAPCEHANAREPANFSAIQRLAAELASQSARPPSPLLRSELLRMNYDQHQAFRERPNATLWRDTNLPFAIELVPAGYLFGAPIEITIVDSATTRRLTAAGRNFRWPDGFSTADDEDVALAGFRILHPLNRDDRWDEVAVFLGASYFRLIGRDQAYGASARGLAIDAGTDREEFPAFRQFWIVRPAPQARTLEFFALLDSPRVVGAYRFSLTPDDVTEIEIEADLYFRADVAIAGYAPLTSMYWRGTDDPRPAADARPRVHDSDGLQIARGSVDWLWRPLVNPAAVVIDRFDAASIRGFGLIQRERRADAYQDREADYARRPSLFVSPHTPFAGGSVRLVLLPTRDEYNDNIVAFWTPPHAPRAGDRVRLHYRIAAIGGDVSADRTAIVTHSNVARSECPDWEQCVSTSVIFVGAFDDPEALTPHVEASGATAVRARAVVLAADTVRVDTEFRLEAARAELRVALVANRRQISETWVDTFPR